MSRNDSGGKRLTPEGLEALLEFLDPDRERAGERYQSIRLRLVRLFEWRGCSHPDELVDEAIDRVAGHLAKGTTIRNDDPYPFFCGVAHNVFREVIRREAHQHKVFGSGEWLPAAVPEEDEPDHRLEHLRECLQTLEADQRSLVLRYHQDDHRIQGRKGLCDELGIPMNALRIRVHRLRRKIESCIEEKMRR